MNSLRKRTLINRDNFKKYWTRKKKYNFNNNYFIFFIKWYLTTFVRFLTNKQFDYDLNLFKLILSIFISLPRSIIVRFVRIIDQLFPPFFGAINTSVKREISEVGSSVIMNTSNKGLDLRMSMWKRDALEIIVNNIEKSDLKEIRFMEIGAASGIVSIILAEWAKKNKVPFKAICIEPSFSNIDFLENIVFKNRYDIRIIPCAINKDKRWTQFEVEENGTKGHLGDAVKNKEIETYKFSISMKEIFSASFKPNFIYIDALLNENLILEQILNKSFNLSKILVEFDNGVSKKIIRKCNKLDLKISKVDKFHYTISKQNKK